MSTLGGPSPRQGRRPELTAAAPIETRTHESVRCRAHSSRTGLPCGKPAVRGAVVCRSHGAGAPQVKRAAADRLKALEHTAVDVLEDLMGDDQPPPVRLGAVREVFTRTGLGADKLPAGALTFTLKIDRGDGDD